MQKLVVTRKGAADEAGKQSKGSASASSAVILAPHGLGRGGKRLESERTSFILASTSPEACCQTDLHGDSRPEF